MGFFGILKDDFLRQLKLPVVNTHPSLLPAFPGLESKVHEKAARDVALTGFTVHLVNAVLDGGPILFQHPVWLDAKLSPKALRERVRKAEQTYLAPALEKILHSNISAEDSLKTSYEVRQAHNLYIKTFVERPA